MLITCDCQHLKQEIKCNASKTSEGNSKKTLSCDDECARLARNQKLALALNIDPEAHKDDHVPYSADTLKMFRESSKWAQTQEREFRVFAADENEKRLRFKPMPPHQRAFLHSLSEDFGFDSESMDPEPHRHVAIFKTPRFVMAPMKTLAECVRIQQAEAALVATVEPPKKLQSNNEPFNGFLLIQPRFALTIEELRMDLSSVLDSVAALAFDISFLPSEEIVIKCRPSSSSITISSDSIAATLRSIRPSILAQVASKNLAHSVQLCALDPSLNVLRREADDAASNGGWSQVAAKAAAPRMAPRQMAVGEKSVYTVLGSRLREANKKKKEEEQKAREAIVEDWEEEVRKDEEQEDKRRSMEVNTNRMVLRSRHDLAPEPTAVDGEHVAGRDSLAKDSELDVEDQSDEEPTVKD
jgi:transcriptional repressor NF-X1